MTDNRNQTGQGYCTLYVDPTPPSPTLVQPAFDQVVNGTSQIIATSADEDFTGMIFSLFGPDTAQYTWVEKNVPHTPQGYGCGPAAAAASLLWFDTYTNASGVKIYDQLVPKELEDPTALTAKLNELFKTENVDPPGVIGRHYTSDVNLTNGLKEYLEARKAAGLEPDFVVKAFGRDDIGPYTRLPNGTDWVDFYKTMLPHEDVLLFLDGKKETGEDWGGHMVTGNSYRSGLELQWTAEGCIWAQLPPYTIDFMDHTADTGYREVKMDRNGTISGLEKYYPELANDSQVISGMIIVSPKVAYDSLWAALTENQSTPYDWLPLGEGTPLLEQQEFFFEWDTTNVPDGCYLLQATAQDKAGNEASDIIWITVDHTAPRTTKLIGTPSFEEGLYLTSATEVTLSAADGEGVGIDSLYYRVWNSGTWSNWTQVYCGPPVVEAVQTEFEGCSASFTLTGNCSNYIEYYAVDLRGNSEAVHNQTHLVDNEAPVTCKEVGEPGYFVNTTMLGEHWIVTDETFIALNGTDDCCKIKTIYVRNRGNKTYHIKATFKEGETSGSTGTILSPNERSQITPLGDHKKLTVTISERKGGKNTPIFKGDLDCEILKFLAVLGGYTTAGDRYTYNESRGPYPFGIADLVLEEFTLEECKGSELKCWSGLNSTFYRSWYNGVWRDWETYRGPFTLDGSGVHYLAYYSVDNLGNAGDESNETFVVAALLLEPFFVTPLNNSLVYGTVTLWAAETMGRNASCATFWHSPDGVNWTYIGLDDDGSEPTVGGEFVNASAWGDGWCVDWNTSALDEGTYYLKVEMYGDEGVGTAHLCVYLDPTPPVPVIDAPWEEERVNGTLQLRAHSADENVRWFLWEYTNKSEDYEKAVEEKIQYHYCQNISGKNLSGVCCGPTAAASCLRYWAEHGYPNLTRNGTLTQSELVEQLAWLMRTTERGTTASNLKRGLDEYLMECGYGADKPHGLSVAFEPDDAKLNFTRYRNEFEANREDVLWLYKWNHNASTGTWNNGHWVVGQAVNNSRGVEGSHEITLMCPSYGKVSNVSMYENGTLYRPDARGWRYPSAMVTVSERGSFDEPSWVAIANLTDPAGGWAALWDTTGVADGYYFVRVTACDETGEIGKALVVVYVENQPAAVFDTGKGTHPSISGTHNGTITPDTNLTVNKLQSYPCTGTGGHAEYVRIWIGPVTLAEAYWNGYIGDWHNITFNHSFPLYADETYNYTLRTGSYPRIIHAPEHNATGGVITCTEFVDVNGQRHEGWIPAIRLF